MQIVAATQTQIIVEQKSPFSGKTNAMAINMSYADFMAALECWRNGQLIQHAFLTLSADEREFIMTGITPAEWDEMFS